MARATDALAIDKPGLCSETAVSRDDGDRDLVAPLELASEGARPLGTTPRRVACHLRAVSDRPAVATNIARLPSARDRPPIQGPPDPLGSSSPSAGASTSACRQREAGARALITSSFDCATSSPRTDWRRASGGPPPRQPHADHRRRGLGQDRGRLTARRRPARRRRAAESIVAFTFTERAAAELKDADRAARRGRLGPRRRSTSSAGLFVGTIHAYCFRLLQQRVPRYETFDVLDDNQLTAFLSREANAARASASSTRADRLFASIEAFLDGRRGHRERAARSRDDARAVPVDPLELLRHARAVPAAHLRPADRRGPSRSSNVPSSRPSSRRAPPPDRRRVPGRQPGAGATDRATHRPARSSCASSATTSRRSTSGAARTWTTSSRSATATQTVATFEITTNRRSRPQIIEIANRFAETIPERIPKTMEPVPPAAGGPEPEVVVWTRRTERDEAGLDREPGPRSRRCRTSPSEDIAVLVRAGPPTRGSSSSSRPSASPSSQAADRACSISPRPSSSARRIAWMTDVEWRGPYGPGREGHRDGSA